jgi:serine/threonine protein kinase
MVRQTVSYYGIVERLGGGGIGVVYKAEDTKLGRFEALKFLADGLSKDRQALWQPRRAPGAAALSVHRNIRTVHDPEEVDSFANSKKECVCVPKSSRRR